jgi:hypothetical protein
MAHEQPQANPGGGVAGDGSAAARAWLARLLREGERAAGTVGRANRHNADEDDEGARRLTPLRLASPAAQRHTPAPAPSTRTR